MESNVVFSKVLVKLRYPVNITPYDSTDNNIYFYVLQLSLVFSICLWTFVIHVWNIVK